MDNSKGINFDPHVSVDCVVFGYDGQNLKVLLSTKSAEAPELEYNNVKLPGRLLRVNEDLDEAANNIVSQLAGSRHPYMHQFRAFGSPNRTANPKDVLWLENATKQKIGRIVTIAYLSLIRITNRTRSAFGDSPVEWFPVNEIPVLAFDHNQIIDSALREVQRLSQIRPQLVFEMLPPKFTALQVRRLFEQIQRRELDARNFAKLVLSKPWIIPLEEWETGVSHRSARYYKFQANKVKR